jgi:hypothetical protein
MVYARCSHAHHCSRSISLPRLPTTFCSVANTTYIRTCTRYCTRQKPISSHVLSFSASCRHVYGSVYILLHARGFCYFFLLHCQYISFRMSRLSIADSCSAFRLRRYICARVVASPMSTTTRPRPIPTRYHQARTSGRCMATRSTAGRSPSRSDSRSVGIRACAEFNGQTIIIVLIAGHTAPDQR